MEDQREAGFAERGRVSFIELRILKWVVVKLVCREIQHRFLLNHKLCELYFFDSTRTFNFFVEVMLQSSLKFFLHIQDIIVELVSEELLHRIHRHLFIDR